MAGGAPRILRIFGMPSVGLDVAHGCEVLMCGFSQPQKFGHALQGGLLLLPALQRVNTCENLEFVPACTFSQHLSDHRPVVAFQAVQPPCWALTTHRVSQSCGGAAPAQGRGKHSTVSQGRQHPPVVVKVEDQQVGGGVAGQPGRQEEGVHALHQLLQPVKVPQGTGLHVLAPLHALGQPPDVLLPRCDLSGCCSFVAVECC